LNSASQRYLPLRILRWTAEIFPAIGDFTFFCGTRFDARNQKPATTLKLPNA